MSLLALVEATEFLYLPPVCLAIALVTSAAHREDMREIWRHALRSWIVFMLGILAFMVAISWFFEWILPA